MALAKGFEENDAGGDGDIQGFNGAGSGQRDDEIATLTGEFVEAFAFAAHDDADGRGVIDFGVALVAVFVEADQPVAGFLQFFHGTSEIGDFRDREVREGPGGSARDRVGEAGGAALGDDNPVSSGGESGANDRAEIVWIFDAVEKNDKAALVLGGIGALEDVFERGGRASGGDGNNALMIAGVGEAVEIAAVLETHGNVALAGELHDIFDARILTAFGDDNAVKRVAGFEGFAHGVNAGESVHGGSLQFSPAS